MAQIHNSGDNSQRMPLFLPLELSKRWLEEELSDADYRRLLDFEIPSEALYYHPVYTIRSPKMRPDEKAKDEVFE